MTSDEALSAVEDLLKRGAASASAGGHEQLAHAAAWLAGALTLAWPTLWAAAGAALQSAAGPLGQLKEAVAAYVVAHPWLAPFAVVVLDELQKYLPSN